MRRYVLIYIMLLCLAMPSSGQSKIVKSFTPACDSLSVLIHERMGVKGPVKLKAVMKRGNTLDFYFTETLGDFPWRKQDVGWLRPTFKSIFPEQYSKYRLGEIYSRKVSVDRLITPELTFNGSPSESRYKVKAPAGSEQLVRNTDALNFKKGLKGRHIALWQSHGRYYNAGTDKWEWQRPCLFQTCEDMLTQGFVLPYLVPMLENAGAYVLLPRERDIQTNEVICDNDPSEGWRGSATYEESGKWADAGVGFADVKPVYEGVDNPFTMGTVRQTACVGPKAKPNASIKWCPQMPERGEYAVYVSYKSLPSSTTAAHYTVHHMGGTSEFIVNQKMGGGTWIYLGTFEFNEGGDGYVMLDNGTPEGHRLEVGAIVTADAVRFGGGTGNIARSGKIAPEDSTSVIVEPSVSGLPRSAEAARYWLQWAGADSTIFHQNEGKNDYKDDFMSRGDWVEWISRDSRVNPKKTGGLGIPVDLSFGFHTDAGVTPNDSLVGTLAIYTYRSEGKTELPSGENRLTSRMYADMVQSQIVNDLRFSHDSLWSRRCIWDRGYRESRTPSSPAMLLELLSHQNFADMKYGLDPSFRFDVSRAIYKGMLKYLSNRYGCDYVVQPLPVSDIGVTFGKAGKAVISWKPVDDPVEPTASPEGYILKTRIDDGAFDTGKVLRNIRYHNGRASVEVPMEVGKIMSFKVCAYNDGGVSFPSEIVSIGMPAGKSSKGTVLIVNNFDRVSGPAFIEGETYAGFDDRTDSGVGYLREITHVGEMYNFNRAEEWISNDRPGFGASYQDMAAEAFAGNTFDYAYVHGKAIMEAGHPFHSCSNERFCCDSTFRNTALALDLICGKQVTVRLGMQQKYTVFSKEMQKSLKDFSSRGGNMLISGAYIGTDVWNQIYPVQVDSTFRAETGRFVKETLGYRYVTGKASRKGAAKPVVNKTVAGLPACEITMQKNPSIYCIESPDGIAPASKSAQTIYRYSDSGISAGVAYEGDGYRCISLGFPLETLKDPEDIHNIISTTLIYFAR